MPSTYMVAQLTVHDPETFQSYYSQVVPVLESFGGKIIAASSGPPQVLEGNSDAQLMVIHQWPSQDAFNAFINSDAYAPIRPLREKSTSGSLSLFDSLL